VATLAFALPVLAAGGTTTFVYGPAALDVLITTQVSDIDTAGECLNFYQDTTGDVETAACETPLVNQVVWTQNAQVTHLAVTAITAPDSGDYCKFNIEIGATGAVKAYASTAATQLVTTVQLLTLNVPLNIADGDLVGIMVGDGDGCSDGASGNYVVSLMGRFVAADSF
jgi:hypothetical protein